MSNRLLAASVLSTAVGLALAAPAPSVRAQGANPPQIVKDNMARMAQGQAGEVLRHQRRRQERLRRGRAFLCRAGDPGARHQVVRAAAGRRLREDSRRQDDSDVTAAMSPDRKQALPYSGESRNRVAIPASPGGAGRSPRRGVDGSPHRELHGRRHAAALSRRHPPRLSDLAARRRAVARQRRGIGPGPSRTHPQSGRAGRARPDVRAHRVERRRRHLSRRPVAAADDRGIARGGVPACRPGPDLYEAPDTGRESVDLSALSPFDHSGMGVHGRGGGAHRLRHPVRRQQHLCQRLQSRLGRIGLSRRTAAGRHRRNPSGRPQRAAAARWRHRAHRRPRLAGHRRGVGALPRGAGAVRPGSDPDRMGHRRAAPRRAARRGGPCRDAPRSRSKRRRAVPTLLETQHAMRASLVGGDDRAAAAMLADGVGADRLEHLPQHVALPASPRRCG